VSSIILDIVNEIAFAIAGLNTNAIKKILLKIIFVAEEFLYAI
jgi:hypothetical protein